MSAKIIKYDLINDNDFFISLRDKMEYDIFFRVLKNKYPGIENRYSNEFKLDFNKAKKKLKKVVFHLLGPSNSKLFAPVRNADWYIRKNYPYATIYDLYDIVSENNLQEKDFLSENEPKEKIENNLIDKNNDNKQLDLFNII